MEHYYATYITSTSAVAGAASTFVLDLDSQPFAALDIGIGTATPGCGSEVHITNETLPAQSFRANLQRLNEQGKLSIPPLSVSGDNIAVINQLNGLRISAVGAGIVNTIRTSLWKLSRSYGVFPLDAQFLHHVVRKFNRRADALANRALDSGPDSRWYRRGLRDFFKI